ncbi:MAG TPA: hypothetical protein PK323_03785 [Bacteroidia bacterium]|nr:hypothetical protein [Bacteroidia bacterium]
MSLSKENSTENYVYINPESRPLMIKLLAFLMMALGLLKLGLWTIAFGLTSIGLFVYVEGIEINFIEKRYRKIKIFGPQKFGNWENFGKSCYISIFKTALISGVTGLSGTSVTAKEKVIQVNLVIEKNQRILAYQSSNKEDAFIIANMLSSKLNIKLWDATEGKGKWASELV